MPKIFRNPFSISEHEQGLYDNRDISRRVDIGDQWGVGNDLALGAQEAPVKQQRIATLWYVLLGMVFLMWARFGYLQLFQGARFAERAHLVSVKTLTLPSERGRMYDTHGALVVDNAPLFSVAITPALFFPHQTLETFTTMARILKEDPEVLQQDIEKLPRFLSAPLLLREGIDAALAIEIATHEDEIPGLSLHVGSTRAYPVPLQSLTHLVGYVGKINAEEVLVYARGGYAATDWVGKTGLEASFEENLRGVPERVTIDVNAQGEAVRKRIATEARRGNDLFLTLDIAVQQHLEEALLKEMKLRGLHKAAAVAVDPKNGAVRALLSLPGVSPSAFVGGDAEKLQSLLSDPYEPLFPRAISGVYPSGSTIKPLFALAALQEGVIRAANTIFSTGGIRVAQWFFPDWKAGGHGSVNLADALAWSVNTYFYTIGGGGYQGYQGLGRAHLQTYLELFKMGEKTGIDIPGEAAGFFPTPARVAARATPWYIGDTYNLSIGQGDLGVTPLQMAMMLSVFANGGTLYRPQLVDRVVDTEGKTIKTIPQVVRVRDLGSLSFIAEVRKGLRAAVERGSAQKLKDIRGGVAGKTGTAQWRNNKPPHAWFIGFYPYNDPSLVVAILVEEGGEGSGIATQVAKDFFEWYAQQNR